MSLISIPFRGPRKYIYGADLVDDAIDATNTRGLRPAVTFSYYDQIQVNRQERIVSDVPLSPRDWAAVIAVSAGETTHHVGFRPVPASDGQRIEAACEESAHRPGLSISGNRGRMERRPGITASPVASTVITTKLVSLSRFPFDDVKWLFAKANLTDLPADWSVIEAETEADDTARFFRWTITIDDQPVGNIIFYRGAA